MTEKGYQYGIDALMAGARTITPETEAEAEEVYRLARASGQPLPAGYIVKAIIRCNQFDGFRMIACDFSQTIEHRHEDIEGRARNILRRHFHHAHPYLERFRIKDLLSAIHFNFRDFGR